jgi:hypothetical protein
MYAEVESLSDQFLHQEGNSPESQYEFDVQPMPNFPNQEGQPSDDLVSTPHSGTILDEEQICDNETSQQKISLSIASNQQKQ